ncbi:MAG TPA: flagellar basal body rod protein FlgC [Verrucomicrobiae bacterium]|jgi:flagellar basal-body rod protein FlgC|nr:flagellar basal body rod protein FlgC [Verrucomicrobiae bacterium]
MIQPLSGIQNTAAALDAERTRLDVISENIANANTTHGIDGKPYQRKVVVFQSALQQAMGGDNANATPTLRVARIENDKRPPVQVYEPGNPDADARGMVSMPNINIHEEMADLISASRAFEANLAVVKNEKSMAMQTLAIGKH